MIEALAGRINVDINTLPVLEEEDPVILIKMIYDGTDRVGRIQATLRLEDLDRRGQVRYAEEDAIQNWRDHVVSINRPYRSCSK